MLEKITVCWNSTTRWLVFRYRLLGGASAAIFRVVYETTLNIATIQSFEMLVNTNKHGLHGPACLFLIYFPWHNTSQWVRASQLSRLHDHTHWTHHTRWEFSGRGISPTQRLLPDNTHKRQTTMPPAGFEPAIPASERPQPLALVRAATGICPVFISACYYLLINNFCLLYCDVI